jgi:glyoxylase-like metal-dependent hydrolase (beta-lactamase superfamily II)
VALEHVGGDHAADSVVMHVVEDGLLMLGDCLYQRLYAPDPYLTPAAVLALTARIQALGARLAIEGHDDTLLDTAAFTRRLHDLRNAAERVHALGAAALETAVDEDDRETLGFLVTGAALTG